MQFFLHECENFCTFVARSTNIQKHTIQKKARPMNTIKTSSADAKTSEKNYGIPLSIRVPQEIYEAVQQHRIEEAKRTNRIPSQSAAFVHFLKTGVQASQQMKAA